MSDPTSTLFKVTNPTEALWRDPYYDKLVDITDLLQVQIAIAQIAAGAKNVKVPKRTKRPWEAEDMETKKIGEARPIAEIDEMLGWTL